MKYFVLEFACQEYLSIAARSLHEPVVVLQKKMDKLMGIHVFDNFNSFFR